MSAIGVALESEAAFPVDRPQLLKASDLAVYPPFLSRVSAAVQRNAVEIGLDLFDLTAATLPDRKRMDLCRAVLMDPESYGARFAWALASLEFMDSAADDATISFQVGVMWDLFAGVPLPTG